MFACVSGANSAGGDEKGRDGSEDRSVTTRQEYAAPRVTWGVGPCWEGATRIAHLRPACCRLGWGGWGVVGWGGMEGFGREGFRASVTPGLAEGPGSNEFAPPFLCML